MYVFVLLSKFSFVHEDAGGSREVNVGGLHLSSLPPAVVLALIARNWATQIAKNGKNGMKGEPKEQNKTSEK